MLYLRDVTRNDMMLLFYWANDPAVRQNAFCTDPIELSTHEQWFSERLSDTETRIYILMKDDIPIGQVRVQRELEDCVIDYSVDKKYRGNGYGVAILDLMEKEIVKEFGDQISLVGVVKATNMASCRVFEQLGYAGAWNENTWCMVYRKLLV